MVRRAVTLTVAGFLTLFLGGAGTVLPVPYVALQPGPTADTLGNVESGDKPMIAVSGRRTFPTDGELNFTTVSYRGGPGSRLDLFTALRGWLDREVAVVPEETIFPPDESVEDVEKQNTEEMTNSQQRAIAAALRQLDIDVDTKITVQGAQQGMPAHGKLQSGDEIVALEGREVTSVGAAQQAINRAEAGAAVGFTVERGGERERVSVVPADSNGRKQVGIFLAQEFEFPIDVEFGVENVGGPSAGLMFSLAMTDKLTEESLTGGESIAGTGTITAEGKVGGIGGIQQKLISAQDSGAEAFLTPAQNCTEAARAAHGGLELVKVDTLRGTIDSLRALRTGNGDIPHC